jgi:protein arginine kinase activator
MKCDRCEREATVHELRVVGGQKVEKHLCESCARDEGIQVQGPGAVSELVGQLMLSASGPAVSAQAARGTTCASCQTSFAEFRQSGLLGCPQCYSTFEAQLLPLLERAHEGGTRHIGKSPRRLARANPEQAPSSDRAERLGLLQRQLEAAIRAEHYEKAATLRDEIRRLHDPIATPTQPPLKPN